MFGRYYIGVLFLSIALNSMFTIDANAVYSPQTGRFLNRDPIGYHGGYSLYAYCKDMPLMRVDPMGWISEQVAMDPVPIQPYTPPTSGPTIIPRGKCILAFECTFAAPFGAKHCGLSITYWNDQTHSSVSKHLHGSE
jgi:hypothetical protein